MYALASVNNYQGQCLKGSMVDSARMQGAGITGHMTHMGGTKKSKRTSELNYYDTFLF